MILNEQFTFKNKLKNIKNVLVIHPFTFKYPYYTLPAITAEYAVSAFNILGMNTKLLDMRFESEAKEEIKKADLVCLFGHSELTPLFTLPSFNLIPEILSEIPQDIPIIA